MRSLLLLLLFVQALHLPLRAAEPSGGPVASTVQVVLHLQDLDDAALGRLASEVGRERNVGIEYSCTWSGVLVLHYTEAPVSERADVVTMTRRLLAKVGLEQGVVFLHITIEPQGPGKC